MNEKVPFRDGGQVKRGFFVLFFKSFGKKAEKETMKLFILSFILFFSHFVFSSQKSDKNLLKNNLQKSQPNQDLLEVLEEVQKDTKPISGDEKISLQLKKTKEPSVRRLAQIPPQPEQKSQQDSKIEDIGERSTGKGDHLKSLLHESVFQRETARRKLDVYVEDQSDLSLQNEEVQEDFGNVEIRWKPPAEDLD